MSADTSSHKSYPVAEPDFSGNEQKYTTDAIMHEGRVSSSGKYLERFEQKSKEFFGRTQALSCSNGTTALHLALHALGIGPGDEVIVPTLTFAATAAVVIHCGATPVFVDVKADDWLMDENELARKRTDKTKAVITVDLYGLPCNYDVIEVWCKKHNIFLVEDAAEAHGAQYKGKMVGSFGTTSCFSFFGNKIITTGEGGMCLTDDEALAHKMRVLKNHGMQSAGRYEHDVVGYNYRLTNLQAALGVAQFERIEEFLAKRRQVDGWYREFLADVPEVTFQIFDAKDIVPAYWLHTILISVPKAAVVAALKEKGIDTRPIFTPMHRQKAYAHFAQGETFPNADFISDRGISLPSSTLLTKEDVRYICTTLKEIIRAL